MFQYLFIQTIYLTINVTKAIAYWIQKQLLFCTVDSRNSTCEFCTVMCFPKFNLLLLLKMNIHTITLCISVKNIILFWLQKLQSTTVASPPALYVLRALSLLYFFLNVKCYFFDIPPFLLWPDCPRCAFKSLIILIWIWFRFDFLGY